MCFLNVRMYTVTFLCLILMWNSRVTYGEETTTKTDRENLLPILSSNSSAPEVSSTSANVTSAIPETTTSIAISSTPSTTSTSSNITMPETSSTTNYINTALSTSTNAAKGSITDSIQPGDQSSIPRDQTLSELQSTIINESVTDSIKSRITETREVNTHEPESIENPGGSSTTKTKPTLDETNDSTFTHDNIDTSVTSASRQTEATTLSSKVTGKVKSEASTEISTTPESKKRTLMTTTDEAGVKNVNNVSTSSVEPQSHDVVREGHGRQSTISSTYSTIIAVAVGVLGAVFALLIIVIVYRTTRNSWKKKILLNPDAQRTDWLKVRRYTINDVRSSLRGIPANGDIFLEMNKDSSIVL